MNERTQEEKDSFGKVKLSELKINKKKLNAYFTEEKIDYLIEEYIGNLKQPNELIVKTLDRSRDRFLIEYAKFEAFYE